MPKIKNIENQNNKLYSDLTSSPAKKSINSNQPIPAKQVQQCPDFFNTQNCK
jgi:hypothetical protein